MRDLPEGELFAVSGSDWRQLVGHCNKLSQGISPRGIIRQIARQMEETDAGDTERVAQQIQHEMDALWPPSFHSR